METESQRERERESSRDNSGRDGDSSTASSVWGRNQNNPGGYCPQPTLLREAAEVRGQEPSLCRWQEPGLFLAAGCGARKGGVGPDLRAAVWSAPTPPTAPTTSIKSGVRKGPPHSFQPILRMKSALFFLLTLTVVISTGERLNLGIWKGWVTLSRYWTLSPRQAGPERRSSNARSWNLRLREHSC